jgi:hypothetical protein
MRARLVLIALYLLTAAVWAGARTQSVRFLCFDAGNGHAIPCDVVMTPGPATKPPANAATFDLLEPIVEFQIDAKDAGYDSRQVRINVSAFSAPTIAIRAFIRKSPTAGVSFTLDDLYDVRTAVGKGDIDRALALLDPIDDGNPDTSFSAQYKYWRASALFQACTKLFYDLCDVAKTAQQTLLADMDDYPHLYKAEHVDRAKVAAWTSDFEVTAVRLSVARAHWYMSIGSYNDARDAYIEAMTGIDGKSPDFINRVKVTKKILDSDVSYMETLASKAAPAQG